MLCVRATSLEKQLQDLALETGKTKSFIVRAALQKLFAEYKQNPLHYLNILETLAASYESQQQTTHV